MKLLEVEGTPGMYLASCPGCRSSHGIYTKDFTHTGPKWEFNGDMEKPTFSPSLLVRFKKGPEMIQVVCHSFIKDGYWEFLSDCTHELAGKTIPMEDM